MTSPKAKNSKERDLPMIENVNCVRFLIFYFYGVNSFIFLRLTTGEVWTLAGLSETTTNPGTKARIGIQ